MRVSLAQPLTGKVHIQVAGITYGKEKKMMAKISHSTEMILTVIPVNWFIEKGPFCIVLRKSKTFVKIGTR